MKRQRLPALLAWAGFALWAPMLGGCGDDTQAMPDGGGGHGGDGGGGSSGGNPMTATLVAGTISQPLDAVPTRDGATIYFTAYDANDVAQVWKVAASGGTPT